MTNRALNNTARSTMTPNPDAVDLPADDPLIIALETHMLPYMRFHRRADPCDCYAHKAAAEIRLLREEIAAWDSTVGGMNKDLGAAEAEVERLRSQVTDAEETVDQWEKDMDRMVHTLSRVREAANAVLETEGHNITALDSLRAALRAPTGDGE